MIGITWRMMVVRRAHALTVFLLATLAIGAAVAAPVFVAAAQRGLLSREVASADVNELTVEAQEVVTVTARPDDPQTRDALLAGQQRGFDRLAGPAVSTPGFRSIFATAFDVTVSMPPNRPDLVKDPLLSLGYRDGYCAAVRITAGRCVSGPGEVIVSDDLGAARAPVTPGSPVKAATPLTVGTTIVVVSTQYASAGFAPAVRVPDGRPERLVVVGRYRPNDPDDPYWGTFAGARMRDVGTMPILTDRRNLANVDHTNELQLALAYPLPGTFSVDHLKALRADIDQTVINHGAVIPSTNIYNLLGRVETDFRIVAMAPTVGAVLLIALCWFVIFIAVTQTAQARRAELGLLTLRGLTSADRWWLAVAETVLPVVAGAVAGYVVGHLAVWGFAMVAPLGSVTVTVGSMPYAVVALTGALAASLLALRRDLRTPAAELLRRVPARSNRWGGGVLLAVLVALAGIAIVQLNTAKAAAGGSPPAAGGWSGLVPFAPALGIIAAGLAFAAALDVVLGWLGVRLLHRGRLAVGLAALHLSRRHSGSRLLALLTVAVALLGFAAIATEVAADARQRRVELGLGAASVVSVGVTTPADLLTATRTVDPTGEFAMAVVNIPNNGNNGPVLAVDASRLSQVALWPSGSAAHTGSGSSAAATSALILSKPLPAPTIFRGTGLELTATLDVPPAASGDVQSSLGLALLLAPVGGGVPERAMFGPLSPGTHTYKAEVDCAAGCRVSDLSMLGGIFDFGRTQNVSVTLRRLGQTAPAVTLVTGPGFASWWDRSGGVFQRAIDSHGLRLTFTNLPGRDAYLSPPDSPERLPLVMAGQRVRLSITTSDGRLLAANAAANVALLPRIGGDGSIVDLESILRADASFGTTINAEVWLNRAAPPDTVDRLRAAGLPVIGERSVDGDISAAKKRPTSIGLQFFLVVAALAVVLGVAGLGVAADVERPARAEDLRWLRIQGLRRRKVISSALWGYLIPIVGAGLFGAIIAEATWRVTGLAVPTVEGGTAHVVPGWWFGQGTVAAWGLACAVLIVAALVLSWALFRAVSRRSRMGTAAPGAAAAEVAVGTVGRSNG